MWVVTKAEKPEFGAFLKLNVYFLKISLVLLDKCDFIAYIESSLILSIFLSPEFIQLDNIDFNPIILG